MAFSLPLLGYLVKKWFAKGGGHGHPRTPLATPLTEKKWDMVYSVTIAVHEGGEGRWIKPIRDKKLDFCETLIRPSNGQDSRA